MATRRRIPPERLGGIEAEGLLQLDKAQGIADAEVDFVVGNLLLNQLVGDVVADGERVEEGALLKDHAGAGAQREELLLGHVGDLFAEEQDAARIGAQEAVGELEQDALSHAGGPEQDAGLTGGNGEADVFQHRRAVEGDGDIAKDHHRPASIAGLCGMEAGLGRRVESLIGGA
jgi:hypothetical protein